MTDNTNPGDGVFSIAGMSFEAGPDVIARWTSTAKPAVAPVDVVIAAGVNVVVDAADPATVLEWSVEDIGDPSALADACSSPDAVQACVAAVQRGEPAPETTIVLRPNWARLALVNAVERWMPHELHEGALILDRAAAYQRTGNSTGAARLVALATPVLDALTQDCVSGHLSGAAMAELADVAEAAADATESFEWGADIRCKADEIRSYAGVSDVDIELIGLWARLESSDPTAVAANRLSDVEALPVDIGSAWTDPRALPPRIVRWRSSAEPEILIEEHGEQGSITAGLSAELATTADEFGYEVTHISAFAADAESGYVLATVATQVSERRVRATLTFERPPLSTVIYGLFDSDTGEVRTNLELIKADRLIIDAWSRHRIALVKQALSSDTADGRDSIDKLLDAAGDLTEAAHSALERAGSGSGDGRASAIAEYSRHLVEQGEDPGVAAGPLLCELLARPAGD